MKKRLVIFEGIASSGKTTLERLFVERVPGSVIIHEDETLAPLFDNRDVEIARQHLLGFFDRFSRETAPVLVIDRFHFSHAFRTHSALDNFQDIEERLLEEYCPIVFLLYMDEAAIAERIRKTTELRGDAWAKGKKGSLDERVAYYTDQQRMVMKFAEHSVLPIVRIDTTDEDWERCIGQVLEAYSRILEP